MIINKKIKIKEKERYLLNIKKSKKKRHKIQKINNHEMKNILYKIKIMKII